MNQHIFFNYFSDVNTWSVLNKICFEPPIERDENVHVCQKSIDLDIQLQKAKSTITKLQKRCSDKSSEINRLKASEKRLRLSKCTMEEILRDFKEKKWISDEGQSVLNVNKPC